MIAAVVLGALSAALAAALAVPRRGVACGRDWSMWSLALGMLASGVPWTQPTAVAVVEQTVAIAAFAFGLFAYPARCVSTGGGPSTTSSAFPAKPTAAGSAARNESSASRSPARDRPSAGRASIRDGVSVAGSAAVLGAVAAIALPPLWSRGVLFGVALPALGLLLLRPRGRDDLTAAARTQIRLIFGLLVFAVAITAALELLTLEMRDLGPVLLLWSGRALPAAIALTVLAARRPERLPAVQRRLRQILVPALVTSLIGGLLVAVPTPVGALAAALLLPPAYALTERCADRLLYGTRPTPYSVLAGIGSLSGTARAGPDLARVAEAVGLGLGARHCQLTVRRPDRPERTYSWAAEGVNPGGDLLTLPIVRGDEQLGSLAVDRATAAGPDVHRQVADIADSLGAVLEANQLGVELERQLRAVRAHAADIAGSRRRLVAEMDAERRRIERDLHDGAQHHLVSLQLALGLAEHRITKGSAEEALAALDRVTGQIDDAEAIMARTATGVTSPVLAQHGLVTGLEAELENVRLNCSGIDAGRRFATELESAVWFCCLEAVNNARKHAPGATIELSLACGPERLEFGVHDDGPGWDMAASDGSPGRGMRNVIKRVSAVGGQVTVKSAPGSGTDVDGWVPLPEAPASFVTSVRELIDDALSHYGDAATMAKIHEIGAGLDPAAARHAAILAAGSALRALDDLIRATPPATGGLRHRLDHLRSGAHELAEAEAIHTLRSARNSNDAEPAAQILGRPDPDQAEAATPTLTRHASDPAESAGRLLGELGPDDVEAATRLLGESGVDARCRLGLNAAADRAEVIAAAEKALTAWRMKASHPSTAPGVRLLAATVVRSCERLLQP